MSIKSEKSVIMVMPNLPVHPLGACEKNRLGVIALLQELGYQVSVVAKAKTHQLSGSYTELGTIPVRTVPYRSAPSFFTRLVTPSLWDGAAGEYCDPVFLAVLEEEIRTTHPSLIWLEYTFLAPLIPHVRRLSNAPIVIRSHNFEALHALEEGRWSLSRVVGFLPKFFTERYAAHRSDWLFAISPDEENMYRHFCGASRVSTLPSGYMPTLLAKQNAVYEERRPLKILFAGASYNIPHNRDAVEILLKEIMPRLHESAPHAFHLHIVGGKLPESLQYLLSSYATYDGYIPEEEFDAYYRSIDIGVVPTRIGRGMQLKVFEPMARGIPTVARQRMLSGYSFVCGKDIGCAERVEEFVEELLALRTPEARRERGRSGREKAELLFGKEILLERIRKGIEAATLHAKAVVAPRS